MDCETIPRSLQFAILGENHLFDLGSKIEVVPWCITQLVALIMSYRSLCDMKVASLPFIDCIAAIMLSLSIWPVGISFFL